MLSTGLFDSAGPGKARPLGCPLPYYLCNPLTKNSRIHASRLPITGTTNQEAATHRFTGTYSDTTPNSFDMADPGFKSFTQTWRSEPYDLISPHRPELAASGRNVVVTGAASGIGKAIALAFVQAKAKSVTIIGRRAGRLESAVAELSSEASTATTVDFQVADLADSSQVTKAFDAIVAKVGKIHVLVSSAGFKPTSGAIASFDMTELVRTFEVNTYSTLNAVQAFATHNAGPGSALLHVASGTAHMAPVDGEGAYNSSKLAAVKLVDQFAMENPDIHVINLHPGWVATEMNGMQEEAPDHADLPGRFCLWLASPEAKFLRGKFVWANWDVSELMQKEQEIQASDALLRVTLGGLDM
ncbi:hypothetical protein SCAR479_02976 [Seiridium cardinale]|uniref:Uncharacterized protein n=1 Tax=Seiridium cardinale TaxID=138064 RepID=A0ABR2Y2S5_9PEZI